MEMDCAFCNRTTHAMESTKNPFAQRQRKTISRVISSGIDTINLINEFLEGMASDCH